MSEEARLRSIEDSPLRDRVVFVEGAPRSGTTFLTAMLSAHDEIAGITGEPRLFEQGVGTLFDNYELGGHLDTFVSRRTLVALVRQLVDGALEELRRTTRPDAGFVVEKTPVTRQAAGTVLERKLECYPDGWYLHIVRDGDAVTRSLSRAPWSQDMTEAERRAWWKNSVDSVRDVLGGLERYREVPYEDLAADPVSTMAEVFAWLGLPWTEALASRIELMAKERYADLGPIEDGSGVGHAEAGSAVPASGNKEAHKGFVRRTARRVARRASRRSERRKPVWLANEFARAFRERDAEALKRFVYPDAELVAHSGSGDLTVEGRDVVDALDAISKRVFSGKFLSESWTLLESDSPSVMFSGTRHDGTRSDAWWVLVVRRGRIERIGVMLPGPPEGRAMRRWELFDSISSAT